MKNKVPDDKEVNEDQKPKGNKSKKKSEKMAVEADVKTCLEDANGVHLVTENGTVKKSKKSGKRKACEDENEDAKENIEESSAEMTVKQKKKTSKREIEASKLVVGNSGECDNTGNTVESCKARGEKKRKKGGKNVNGTTSSLHERSDSTENSGTNMENKDTEKAAKVNGLDLCFTADGAINNKVSKEKKSKDSKKQTADEWINENEKTLLNSDKSAVDKKKTKEKAAVVNADISDDSAHGGAKDRSKRDKCHSETAEDADEPDLKKTKLEENGVEEKVIEPGDFSNFRISPGIIQLLKAKGVNSLFPVQIKSFDVIYDNFDVIVQARTGSGKTLSFALPLVEKLMKKMSRSPFRAPQVLVMAPTRELAKQIADTFSDISTELKVACFYGGSDRGQQVRAIRSGIDVLVGTPGRLLDLLNCGKLDLSQLGHVVLDEVDRMLEMGFVDQVDEILKYRYTEGDYEKNPQTLLFSATLPHWVHQTANKYLRPDQKHVDLVGDDRMKTSKTVQHLAIQCSYFDRAATVGAVLQVYSGSQGRAMVFCETKRDADELALSQDIKQETPVIHGDIPQEKREMVLKGFRDGRHRCLIATDVAARGLDIPEVDLVIQCCPPKDVDSYIHRSGRTGRAGREGTCVLFYKPNEEFRVYDVERRAGITFKQVGPPTTSDIINASAQDAARSIVDVAAKTSSHFKPLAENLLKEHNAADLLAAALAVISGNAELKPRSLLTSREGFTTFIFRTNMEMRQLGYAWRSLQRWIIPELNEKISKMRFLADKKGCVFDIPSEHEEELENQWKDGRFDTLTKATELPELAAQEFSSARQSSSSFHGRNNSGGTRFSGRSFSHDRGGNYRNFNSRARR